jgi:hypothetical protein
MSDVTIFWSKDGSAVSFASPFNFDDVIPGDEIISETVEFSFYFTSTAGVTILTDCGLYLSPFSGIYPNADRSALSDWRAIRSWGDVLGQTIKMGVQFNMNKADDYPDGDWVAVSSTVGCSQGNKITLSRKAVVPSGGGSYGQDGSFPIDAVGYLQARVVVPYSPDITGKYFGDIVFDYTT